MALKTIMTALVLAAGLGLGAEAALAADPAPAPTTAGGKAVLTRQAHYKELNGAFRAINEQLRADAPDKAAIAANAAKMKALAADLPSWFPKGSGPETGVKTYALPAIWQKNDDFVKLGKAAQAEAVKLDQIAGAKDLNGLKAQAVTLGKACKACHDNYRSPDYEKDNED